MAQRRIELSPLALFDPVSDPTSLGPRWKAWKRHFETYSAALGVADATQKGALLLYQAGQATQEIFDAMTDSGEANHYNNAMEKLDEYFSPKKNVDYEIFKFRTTVQLPNQTVDQFATRLRNLDINTVNHNNHNNIVGSYWRRNLITSLQGIRVESTRRRPLLRCDNWKIVIKRMCVGKQCMTWHSKH